MSTFFKTINNSWKWLAREVQTLKGPVCDCRWNEIFRLEPFALPVSPSRFFYLCLISHKRFSRAGLPPAFGLSSSATVPSSNKCEHFPCLRLTRDCCFAISYWDATVGGTIWVISYPLFLQRGTEETIVLSLFMAANVGSPFSRVIFSLPPWKYLISPFKIKYMYLCKKYWGK